MKKHKLVRITASMSRQIDYLRNLALERLDANTALRRELADLRTGCNGAIERNVQLVAEFNALEQAHEYTSKKADECYARAEAADALIVQLEKNLEVQGRNASNEYARAQRLRDDVANLQATITNLAKQRDAALARAHKSDEMFSRIQALCGSEDV